MFTEVGDKHLCRALEFCAIKHCIREYSLIIKGYLNV